MRKGVGDEGQGEGDGERSRHQPLDRAGKASGSIAVTLPSRCSYRSETSLLWLLQFKKQTGRLGRIKKEIGNPTGRMGSEGGGTRGDTVRPVPAAPGWVRGQGACPRGWGKEREGTRRWGHSGTRRVTVSLCPSPGADGKAGKANADTAPVGIAATRARGVRLLRLGF